MSLGARAGPSSRTLRSANSAGVSEFAVGRLKSGQEENSYSSGEIGHLIFSQLRNRMEVEFPSFPQTLSQPFFKNGLRYDAFLRDSWGAYPFFRIVFPDPHCSRGQREDVR